MPRWPANQTRLPAISKMGSDTDAVLSQAIEQGVPGNQIQGDPDIVRRVLRARDANEYQRRQAPLVLRVSGKAFGTGRRLPIVHRSGWGV